MTGNSNDLRGSGSLEIRGTPSRTRRRAVRGGPRAHRERGEHAVFHWTFSGPTLTGHVNHNHIILVLIPYRITAVGPPYYDTTPWDVLGARVNFAHQKPLLAD